MDKRIIVANMATLLMVLGVTACDSTSNGNQPDQAVDQAAAETEVISEPQTAAETTPETMAFGRFVPEREDDFAWENDKVAFRIYGPSSSGKGQVSGVDAWLKKVPYSIIDKWYAGHQEGISYHKDHGEGYDPFHVGDSRGVGGTAVWIDGAPWPAGKYMSYETHKSGDDLVKFAVKYEWETPLGVVGESKTISLAMGEQLYRVNSVFTLDGAPASLPVAIGLTTHDEKAKVSGQGKLGRISTSEKIDEIGVWTGALLDPARTLEVVHVPSDEKDASHIWLLTTTADNGTLEFQAGFAWEAAGDIESFEQWNEYLDSRVSRD